MFTPGATSLNGDCGLRWLYFNPRTRMGCDQIDAHGFWRSSGFQSTHPHGVRQSQPSVSSMELHNFNPRTRMGCDQQ